MKISLIGTYIKRRGNLEFIEERSKVSDVVELEACIEESFSSLRLLDIDCACSFPEGEKIYVRDAVVMYQFFENVCAERNITCESAGGKTKIPEMIGKAGTEETCIIADGAAIGAEMNLLSNKIEEKQNVHLYLPESFEWLILNSDLLQDKEVRKILENPEDYIDSTEFFSWEQYFTKLLIQKTEGTYLQYKKAKLNPSYLQDKNKNKILESIQGIQWKIKSLK